MASPTTDFYAAASGQSVVGGQFSAKEVATIEGNGIWTWFTDPRAVYYNGNTYIGWVNSSGSIGITKYNHTSRSSSSFILSASLEVDDHDNAAILIRPDGRILAMYGKHNDTSGFRYRISTNAEDITAWGSEVVRSSGITLPVSYSNPFYLSQSGKIYCFFRSGAGGVGTNPWGMVESSDYGATWSNPQFNFLTNTGARPYPKWVSNGVDRIDIMTTNCHPNEGVSSIYHFYGKLDGSNVIQYYKTDGTLIGTSVTVSDLTLIYDGTTKEAWVWDITYGSDGNPRVVFVKFESTTDQRFMFSRWTGSAWTTPVEITSGGQYLYSGEQNYSGGICFDSKRPDTVYLSKQVGSYWEIQHWRTADDGATWAKQRDITTGSTVKNCRPYSPRNHNGDLPVIWWSGTYTSYTNYNTAIKGIRR